MEVKPREGRGKLNILKKVILITLAVFTVIGITAIASLHFLRVNGSRKLGSRQDYSLPELPAETLETGGEWQIGDEPQTNDEPRPDDEWQPGDVRYLGKIYRLNREVTAILCMGVDKLEEVAEAEDGLDGGQTDGMFLVVLDWDNRRITVISINRNTMTEIEVYDRDGDHLGTVTAQLTLQHGYGDGREVSCERTMGAVSRLFYGIPIDGYCAVNMGAIAILNDLVGGVELEALAGVEGLGWVEGTSLKLMGNDALLYLRHRDVKQFGSADLRLERQKQYIGLFAAKAREELRSNILLPLSMYNSVKEYLVTDLTLSEIVWLASEAAGFSAEDIIIRSLDGETVQGEQFEEFYADETALYELILDVFYTEVQEK